MRSSVFVIALAVGLSASSPLQALEKREAVDGSCIKYISFLRSLTFLFRLDTTVLNFALTLEHIENAFYHQALAKFDQQAFLDAGLPEFARGRFEQVAAHEATHVQFLSTALGDNATQPCTYNL